METTSSSSSTIPPRRCFLHAQFSIANDSTPIDGAEIGPKPITVVKHRFLDSGMKDAVIGFQRGSPVKPEPGDYSYSGVHDHGTFPALKEGGVFARIIGLLEEAKRASDLCLTEVIEMEERKNAGER